jgi:hypothetical protein
MSRVTCSLAICFCLVKSAIASPMSEFRMDSLIESSNWIGVCQVQKVTMVRAEPHKPGLFEAECKVLSVFRGQSLENVIVSSLLDLQANRVNLAFGCLKKGDIAVLFLKNGKQDTFAFAHRHHPKIPLVKFYVQHDVATNSIHERVSTQLREALESNEPSEVINGIHWLTKIGDNVPQVRLIQFADSEDKGLRMAALQRLVVQNNTAAIRDVALLLLAPSIDEDILESQIVELAWVLESAAGGVDVALANRLAASANCTVQRIGVRILRVVGSRSSIPQLIRALDADDKDTQMSAVIGLSRIAGKKGPSFRDFMKDPSGETQKWRVWWAKQVQAENSENGPSSD